VTNANIRPRVLLDVDGVLADFVGELLTIANSLLSASYTREQITQFDWAASLGLAPRIEQLVSRCVSAAPGLARDLVVLPGAQDGVRRLRALADVYIVTSPWPSSPTWCHDRYVWLDRYFGIAPRYVVHAMAKHIVSGDVLIDDRTATLNAWQAAHPRGAAVQWQTPHNRLDDWAGVSTSNWDRVIEIVERRVEAAAWGEPDDTRLCADVGRIAALDRAGIYEVRP
jgi:5'(3')-deoxyribonucleotidase